MISTARTCSLIVIVLDALKPLTHKKLIEHELEVGLADDARHVIGYLSTQEMRVQVALGLAGIARHVMG